jgi:hypothetical protein
MISDLLYSHGSQEGNPENTHSREMKNSQENEEAKSNSQLGATARSPQRGRRHLVGDRWGTNNSREMLELFSLTWSTIVQKIQERRKSGACRWPPASLCNIQLGPLTGVTVD